MNIGKPWWRQRTLRRTRHGLEGVVSDQGRMTREARRELRQDALGKNRAGKGIVGYRSNR